MTFSALGGGFRFKGLQGRTRKLEAGSRVEPQPQKPTQRTRGRKIGEANHPRQRVSQEVGDQVAEDGALKG